MISPKPTQFLKFIFGVLLVSSIAVGCNNAAEEKKDAEPANAVDSAVEKPGKEKNLVDSATQRPGKEKN